MTICYIILFHKSKEQLIDLINQLSYKNSTFVIHIDKPVYTKNLVKEIKQACLSPDNVHIIENPVNVHWGGFSFAKAILISMKKSLDFNPSHISLLSIQDFPVKTNEYIHDLVKSLQNKSLLEHSPYSANTHKYNRLNRFYFYDYYLKDYNKSQSFNIVPRIMTKILPKRKINFIPYWGRIWWFLSYKHAKYIVDQFEKNNPIVKFLKYSLLPDELVFATLLANSKYKHELILQRTTYADYNSPHPREIEVNEIDKLIKSEYLFARKFIYKSDSYNTIKAMLQ